MTSENAGGGDGKQVASPPSFFDAQSLKNGQFDLSCYCFDHVHWLLTMSKQ